MAKQYKKKSATELEEIDSRVLLKSDLERARDYHQAIVDDFQSKIDMLA